MPTTCTHTLLASAVSPVHEWAEVAKRVQILNFQDQCKTGSASKWTFFAHCHIEAIATQSKIQSVCTQLFDGYTPFHGGVQVFPEPIDLECTPTLIATAEGRIDYSSIFLT